MVENGNVGTAIVTQLVATSEAREQDKLVLQAISSSVEASLFRLGITNPDVLKWMQACNLAAYELGRINLFKPIKEPTKP